DDDGLVNLALFHGRVGGAVLDVDGDDVANGRRVGVLAFFGDHRGAAGAGVVGDVDDGAKLKHGGLVFKGERGETMRRNGQAVGAAAGSVFVILVGTCAATSASVMATASVVKAFSRMEVTRQRLRRLSGRVAMTSTLSPGLVSFFSSWTCSTVWRLTTLW